MIADEGPSRYRALLDGIQTGKGRRDIPQVAVANFFPTHLFALLSYSSGGSPEGTDELRFKSGFKEEFNGVGAPCPSLWGVILKRIR